MEGPSRGRSRAESRAARCDRVPRIRVSANPSLAPARASPSACRSNCCGYASGERPTRIHNNCSGKHSAMLALAREKDWPTREYEGRDHNVQRAILHEISLWTGLPCGKIKQAVDGCGVVVFGMTLERMARAYSCL